LIHAQHLSGVGHHVRMDLLARALARRHEVYVVDGGEPVPRRSGEAIIRAVPLPRIRRTGGAIVALAAPDTGAAAVRTTPPADVAALLDARARRLEDAVRTIRPDLVIVEHFPFSKWELADEILRTIAAARAVRPAVRVVSSIRDIVVRTQFETGDAEHTARVLATLNGEFDMLLVHSDPAFVRLEESFARAREIRIPVVHTGFIAEDVAATRASDAPDPQPGAPYPRVTPAGGPTIVASTGGGEEGFDLARHVVRAFGIVARRLPEARLELFAGLFWPPDGITRLRDDARSALAEAPRAGIDVTPFAIDFLDHLAAADVSVSRAGYNTCVNVVATRARALLIPSARRSDQRPRAERLRARGLAEVLDEDLPEPDALAAAVLATLARARPAGGLDLDGVARSCATVETLLDDRRDGYARLARALGNDDGVVARRALAAVAGDPELVETLQRHHLLPPLCTTVPDDDLRTVLAPDVHAALRARRASARTSPAEDLATIAEAQAALAAEGVECMLLKGLYFAHRLYGDVARRHQHDIDLVVRRADARRAARGLRALGYVERWRDLHSTNWARGSARLDLHVCFRNTPAYRLDERRIWADRVPYAVDGLTFTTPSDEDTLVLLALSLFQDVGLGAAKLKQLLDVYLLTMRIDATFAWDEFLARRRAERTLRVVVNALDLVVRVFAADTALVRLAVALAPHRQLLATTDRARVLDLVFAERSAVASKIWFFAVYPGSLAYYWLWLVPRKIPGYVRGTAPQRAPSSMRPSFATLRLLLDARKPAA
jgi:predicted glycosyltransferase